MMNENINDVHYEFEEVRTLVIKIRNEILSKAPWGSEQDIRSQFINQLHNILLFNSINTKYYVDKISNIDYVVKELALQDTKDYYSFIEGYTVYNRNALIYSLSSIDERYIHLILKSIDDSVDVKYDFRKVRKILFQHLGIAEESNEWKALSTLSNIRNTIHNNGVHSSSDKRTEKLEYIYRDFFVSFQNEEVHFMAKYKIIIFIIIDILRLTRIINNSPLLSGKTIIGEESFL